MFCTQCGREHSPEDKFCAQCGNPVSGSPGAPWSGNWWDSVPDVINNRASFETFVRTLLCFLEDTNVIGDAMGESQALSRRLVWTYADDTVLWRDPGGATYVSHLTKEFKESARPLLLKELGSSHLAYSLDTNGWIYTGPLAITELVQKLEETRGKPTLILPWEAAVAFILGIDDDGGLYGIYEEAEDDTQTEKKFDAILALFQSLANSAVSVPDNRWDLGVDFGSGYMPQYSKVGRFNSLLDALEDRGWLILRDECCGECANQSIEQEGTDRANQTPSVFITWGQEADQYWRVSGGIDHTHHATPEEAVLLRELASRFGVSLTEGKAVKGRITVDFS